VHQITQVHPISVKCSYTDFGNTKHNEEGSTCELPTKVLRAGMLKCVISQRSNRGVLICLSEAAEHAARYTTMWRWYSLRLFFFLPSVSMIPRGLEKN